MKVKTTYYLDDNNEWLVEKDGDTYWLRTANGYQMVSRDLLEALQTALVLLLDKNDE
jgi:hypothetical protein